MQNLSFLPPLTLPDPLGLPPGLPDLPLAKRAEGSDLVPDGALFTRPTVSACSGFIPPSTATSQKPPCRSQTPSIRPAGLLLLSSLMVVVP